MNAFKCEFIKIPHWDRKSADDQGLTARTLFTEENSDGEI